MNFISPLLRVFALKMIYHTWQLPNFLNSAWGIVVMYLAPRRAAPQPRSCKSLSVQKVVLDTCWKSSKAASLCSPAARSVSGDTKTFWLKEGRKQNCHPVLQECRPTIELGRVSPSLSEGQELQSWCSRDKHTAENAPDRVLKLFLIYLF